MTHKAKSPSVVQDFAHLRIALDLLHLAPENPRRADGPPSEADLELVASVKELGVLEPLLVRPMAGGHYEIRAGARRVMAARKAGLKDVPCVVRQMDDDEAMLVTVAENMHREDLTAIEEADGVAQLLAQGLTLDRVADVLGRPRGWVARRARMAGIPAKHMKKISSEEMARQKEMASSNGYHADPFVCIESLELIASLPADEQDRIFAADSWPRYVFGPHSRHSVVNEFVNVLDRAPFDPADVTLVPAAGACAACPHRGSQQPGLFDVEDEDYRGVDAKSDRCLKPTCWKAKHAAALAQRLQRAKDRNPAAIAIFKQWPTGYDKDAAAAAEVLALTPDQYQVAKKGTPGAVPAVGIEDAAGKTVWVVPVGKGRTTVEKHERTVPTAAERAEAKAHRLRQRVRSMALDMFVEAFTAREGSLREPYLKNVSLLVALVGTETSRRYPADGQFQDWKRYLDQDELDLALADAVEPVLCRRLRPAKPDEIDGCWSDGLGLAEILNADMSTFVKRAQGELGVEVDGVLP